MLNSARFRGTPFPAVGLHASALSLARFYDDVVRPSGVVAGRLGHDLWRAYVSPAAVGHDLVLDRPVTWTLGFQVDEEDGRVALGMGGAGGCSAWAEPAAGYGAAYLTRGLGGHDRAELVWDAVAAGIPPTARMTAASPRTALRGRRAWPVCRDAGHARRPRGPLLRPGEGPWGPLIRRPRRETRRIGGSSITAGTSVLITTGASVLGGVGPGGRRRPGSAEAAPCRVAQGRPDRAWVSMTRAHLHTPSVPMRFDGCHAGLPRWCSRHRGPGQPYPFRVGLSGLLRQAPEAVDHRSGARPAP